VTADGRGQKPGDLRGRESSPVDWKGVAPTGNVYNTGDVPDDWRNLKSLKKTTGKAREPSILEN